MLKQVDKGRVETHRTSRNPFFFLLVVCSIGRAYLKVHGGPAPQCAPSLMNSCYSWLAPAMGLFYRPCIAGSIRWWVWRQLYHHIGSVVYWKCTGALSRGV